VLVRPAWKADPERLTNARVRAVAAGDEPRSANPLSAGGLESGANTSAVLAEVDERGLTMDLDPELAQALDQKLLVLVLREDQRVGKRTDARANLSEDRARPMPPGDPQVEREDSPSLCIDRLRKADLLIELEGARLHGERARRGAGTCGLVDDLDANAVAREEQGEHKAAGAGAGNQDIAVEPGLGHFAVLRGMVSLLPHRSLAHA
jgi:hypothetical protein